MKRVLAKIAGVIGLMAAIIWLLWALFGGACRPDPDPEPAGCKGGECPVDEPATTGDKPETQPGDR